MPPDGPVAFEFRHPSWTDPAVDERLRGHGAARVIVDDAGDEPAQLSRTGSLTYLRLRSETYSDDALFAWLRRIEAVGGERAFVFFKHEEAGAGPALALRMHERAQALAMR